MAGRREVRVSPTFFDQLDRQLGPDRGPAGEPSATDFLVVDLPSVVERFATFFDALPDAVVGVPQARVLISTGRVVTAFAVYGLLIAGGAIELIGIVLITSS